MSMSNYAKAMTRMTNMMSSNTKFMSGLRSPEGKHLYPMKNGPRGFTNLLGSQVIYNKLVENGIKNLFLSNQRHIISPVDSFDQETNVKYITSHKKSATHSAVYYAKLTNRVGVSIVPYGEDLLHSISAIKYAKDKRIPLIVLSSNIKNKTLIQNITDNLVPITKWSYDIPCINAIPDVIDEAFRYSQFNMAGPIYLNIEKSISSGRFENNGKRFRFDHEYEPPNIEKIILDLNKKQRKKQNLDLNKKLKKNLNKAK